MRTLNCLTNFLSASVAVCSLLRMSLEMKSAAGLSMAKAGSWLRCAIPPLSMPLRKSRLRWSSQRLKSTRKHSMSCSMRHPESLTTLCWRPQATVRARCALVKIRRPLNYGTESAASTSNATAPMMICSSATSLPIGIDGASQSWDPDSPGSPLWKICCSLLIVP
uniref:Secreted protein n=1 Tax=Monodelphis domestica TaxID=13616 RepID=A0A5F8G922_MONDO